MLINQIRNIILNKPISNDLNCESEEMADLQEAIYYLSNCLSESNEFLKELARGNLNANPPSRHNFLAGSLKELHSGLNHLTWQANQVASGDYNQQVSFLGAFSVSFNKMIEQLCEREEKLKCQSNVLVETNSLIMSIMDGLNDWIVVTARESDEIIYANKSAKKMFYNPDTNSHLCNSKCELFEYLVKYRGKSDEQTTIEFSCKYCNKELQIRTFLIQWHESMAYVHYIQDVTDEKEEREQIEELAYRDELTDLYNRRYCVGQLDHLLKYNNHFSFCMIDLDGLKYANDNFGHAAGDEYLKIVASEMRNTTRNVDIVCRIGGDEFAIIIPSCSAEIILNKMEDLNKRLDDIHDLYPMSISYGVVYVDRESKSSSEDIMALADEKMYIQKRMKKKKYT